MAHAKKRIGHGAAEMARLVELKLVDTTGRDQNRWPRPRLSPQSIRDVKMQVQKVEI